ncbi:hypothetical protein C0199_00375 [Candidatus Bathyarchaeota archaeon]|nr:MAG: hypothetical protein C0199_00375 [Candidatus Bathyarchaeota archaeon]
MGKAAWQVPLYVSVTWVLMVGYQMFTETAVKSLINFINVFWPFVGEWLFSRMGMLVFVSAFAWVFVLSSVIPSVILGRERSVLVQFFVCLSLTFLAFIALDSLKAYGGHVINYMLSFSTLLENPFAALAYLSMPYIIMLAIDLQTRRKNKKKRELENVTNAYLKNAVNAEQKRPRFNNH